MGVSVQLSQYETTQGERTIYVVNHDRHNKRFKLNTGVRTFAPWFNKNIGRVKDEDPMMDHKNLAIEQTIKNMYDAILDIKSQGKYPEKVLLQRYFKHDQGPLPLLQRYHEYMSLAISKKMSTSTRRTRKAVAEILGRFEYEHGTIMFEDIDQEFYDRLVGGILSGIYNKKKKPLTNKSVKIYLGVIGHFLKWSFGKYHKNDYCFVFGQKFSREYKVVSRIKPVVTVDEIEILRGFEYSSPIIKLHVDAFLFSCRAGGFRYKDLLRLDSAQVTYSKAKDYYYIANKATRKAHKNVTVALFRIAREIYEEYKGEGLLFKGLKENGANEYLRAGFKEAGIDRKYFSARSHGSYYKEFEKPLHDEISTHCARHTFSVFFLENGGTIFELSKILGHSSISTTDNYIKNLPFDPSSQLAILQQGM